MILDSLKQELARVKNDTQRVLIYEKMAHMAPSRRTRVEYGQQGLALAKRIRYDRGAILCGIALGSNLIQVDYYRAISILHETRQLCEKQNNQYELAKALAYLGYAYNYYDHQTGMAYYKRCEKLMKKIGMSEDVMPISLGIGTAYKDWGSRIPL